MKKYVFMFASICLCLNFLFIIEACNKNNLKNGTITIIDMEGTQVSIPKNIEKVACISQSATDLMIAFGVGDKIVGTYRSFTYNPWATEIYPNAKNYKAYSYSVSAEELLSDSIELVIIQDTENAQAFRNAGIPVVAVHQYSPTGAFDDEVYDTAKIIGDILGRETKEKADAWIKEVKDTISDIQSKIGTTITETSVYYVNGEKAKGLYYSDGGNSMISRILNIANVQLATEKYKVLNVHKVSDEEMVSLNPYAMLIGGTYQNKLIDDIGTSPIWNTLDCNKNNRVYRIPVAMIGIENVSAETPVMLKYVANLFNPNYTFDINTELKANVQKYFGYTLTDKDINNMCLGLDKNGKKLANAN